MLRHLLAFAVMIAAPPIVEAQTSVAASRGASEIVVNGAGSVRIKSDRASVTVAVITRANSAAAATAAAAGGTLGPVVEITLLEDDGAAYAMSVSITDSGTGASVGTPLRARDVNMTVRVRVRYAFVPPA